MSTPRREDGHFRTHRAGIVPGMGVGIAPYKYVGFARIFALPCCVTPGKSGGRTVRDECGSRCAGHKSSLPLHLRKVEFI